MTDTMEFNGVAIPAIYSTKTTDADGKVHVMEIDFRKVHPDYMVGLLTKATQRFVNDGLGSTAEKWGGDAQMRYEEYRKQIRHINSGEAPQKIMRKTGNTMGEVEKLAHKMAKQKLVKLGKGAGFKTLSAMADSEPFGPFFTSKANGDLIWNGDSVAAFIALQKKAGKFDFVADAEKEIAEEENNLADVDISSLLDLPGDDEGDSEE